MKNGSSNIGRILAEKDKNLAAWLTLWRVRGVGPVLFRDLCHYFESPEQALKASHAQLIEARVQHKVAAAISSASLDDATPDLKWLEQDQQTLLTWGQAEYPRLLTELGKTAPPLLFVKGDVKALSIPQLAMVGSRNPTASGKNIAKAFAQHLSANGLAITSGLAYGIDAASHEGALKEGGCSIAVMATGADRVYPARHRNLAHQIAEQGALVTEFPIGVQPRAQNFPRRNRLISGLSLGTLVVEAAMRSGSLITARFANEQGREVFAIPGSIHNPMVKGCHRLIRQGAKLVETADDVFEELTALLSYQLMSPVKQSNHDVWSSSSSDQDESDKIQQLPLSDVFSDKNSATIQGDDPNQKIVLEAMEYELISIEKLIAKTQLSPEIVASVVLILELQGLIATSGGGMYSRNQS